MFIMFLRNSLFLSLLLFWLLGPTEKMEQESVYAELSIPKLELKENIYLKDSKYNDLNHGLYLLPESDYLFDEDSQMIVLSHSGNSSISHFKDLDQVMIHDKIVVTTTNVTYFFKVMDIYAEKKDGKIAIKKPREMSLVLVTCTKYTNDLQTVVIAKNVGKLIKNE